MKYGITTDSAPKPSGTYSQGTSAARYIFVSAQLPISPKSEAMVEGTPYELTLQALHNIEAVLEDVEMNREDIAQTTVYTTDLDITDDIDRAFDKFFFLPYPARTLVEVRRLPQNALLSIECIACR